MEEARRRPARLGVVHALNQRRSGASNRANPTFVAEELRAAEDVLDTAVGQARRDARGLTVLRAWSSPAIYVDVPGSAKWAQVEKVGACGAVGGQGPVV